MVAHREDLEDNRVDIEQNRAAGRVMVDARDNQRDRHEEGQVVCLANHLASRHPHHSRHRTRWRERLFARRKLVRLEQTEVDGQRERSIPNTSANTIMLPI